MRAAIVVTELITSLGGSSAHERRVARIATKLLDVLLPVHGLKRSDRKLLRIAALLHDAGRVGFGAENHHIRGAKIVRNDLTLPFTASQRRAVQYLVRYHCGRVPRLGRDDILQPGDRRRKVRILLGLLRAADGLDSRRAHCATIVVRRKGRRLRIRCIMPAGHPRARQILRRKAKFDLLEQTLRLRVKLRVLVATPEAIIT